MPEIAPVEPEENPNPKIVVDPPRWLRFIIRRIADKVTNPAKRARRARGRAIGTWFAMLGEKRIIACP